MQNFAPKELCAASLVFVIAITSCSTQVEPLTQLPPGAKLVETADTVVREYYSGVADHERLVIRNAAAWGSFWQQVYSRVQPQPPVPTLNGGDMIVAATMGTRRSGGYSIDIDAVYEANDQLVVVVREASPGSSCGVTAALTAPVVAVRVPQSAAVSFVEKTETRDCGK